MKYEITIPVLNEESTIRENILSILDFLKCNNCGNVCLIIADNGSTDNTEVISRELSASNENVEYLKVHKKGVGLALRTSWSKSKADFVGYMDLDLATDINHLKQVFSILDCDKDIVNGSRLLKDSKVINRSVLREFTSRVFNLIAKIMLGYSVSDGMCGFKFFKRSVVMEVINTGVDIDGWFFSTEVLARSEWLGYNIIEIPVKWTDDRDSKVKVIKLSLEYLKQLIRLRKERKNF